VNEAELTGSAKVLTKLMFQFLRDLVGLALELLGPIFSELGDGRLGGVPVARAVLIEIGRRC
jgi:hypothetical protein